MKKRMLIFVVALAFILAIPAVAVEPRAAVMPTLSFEGTEATCKVQIFGNSSSESITATIKLWHGGSCVETWYRSSTGNLIFEDTADVERGETYKLTVDAVIGGRPMSTAYVERTCS